MDFVRVIITEANETSLRLTELWFACRFVFHQHYAQIPAKNATDYYAIIDEFDAWRYFTRN